MSTKQKGIIFMLISASSLAVMQLFIKLSGGRIPLFEQIFARNFVTAIISFAMTVKHKAPPFGKKEHFVPIFLRSLFGFISFVMMFYATNNAPQGDVAVLTRMQPFVISILSFLIFKDRIPKIQIVSMTVAFLGAAMVANPAFNTEGHFFPLICAFMTSVTAGAAYTVLSKVKNENNYSIVTFFSVFCMIACIPFICVNFVMPTPYELLMLLFIGLFGASGQIALTFSYRMAPATEVSIYNYSGIIVTMVLSFVVLGEAPKWNSLVGALLVIGAALITYIFANSKKNKKEEAEKAS